MKPQVGDPIVVDGQKYRIRTIDEEGALWLKQRFQPHLVTRISPENAENLTFDKRVGVWR